MAKDRSAGRAILRGLMIGNPQDIRARPALDQINGAAQNEAAINLDRLAPALRIAPGRLRKAKPELKQPRLPCPALRKLTRPDMEIGANTGNFILPDVLHSRPEKLCIIVRHPGQSLVDNGKHSRCRSRRNRDRPLLQGAEELRQHLMKQSY